MIAGGFAVVTSGPYLDPVPPLVVGVAPPASRSQNHVAGRVTAAGTSYAVPAAFSWYASGRLLLNRGGRRYIGVRGTEDIGSRKA